LRHQRKSHGHSYEVGRTGRVFVGCYLGPGQNCSQGVVDKIGEGRLSIGLPGIRGEPIVRRYPSWVVVESGDYGVCARFENPRFRGVDRGDSHSYIRSGNCMPTVSGAVPTIE